MANTTEYRWKTEGTRREAFLILREDLTANVFSDGFYRDFQARHMADSAQGSQMETTEQ